LRRLPASPPFRTARQSATDMAQIERRQRVSADSGTRGVAVVNSTTPPQTPYRVPMRQQRRYRPSNILLSPPFVLHRAEHGRCRVATYALAGDVRYAAGRRLADAMCGRQRRG